MTRPIHAPINPAEEGAANDLAAIVGDISFLRPTKVGLHDKSLLDAVKNVRAHFMLTGFHDFEQQEQGSKVLKPALLVDGADAHQTIVSLYRPKTKKGDPRFWVRDLVTVVDVGELLALFVVDDQLVICNASRASQEARERIVTLVKGLPDIDGVLAKVRAVANSGWIQSVGTPGDNALGMAVEHALKVAPNSRPGPDLDGVEIKSGRAGAKRPMQLFSKVPDWKLGGLVAGGRGRQLVADFGWAHDGDGWHLVHDVSTKAFNSKGLKLVVEPGILELHHRLHAGALCRWSIETLKQCLAAKHRATMWVTGVSRIGEAGSEEFQLSHVVVTRQPRLELLPELLASDGIFVSLLLGRASGGDTYSFKLRKTAAEALFPDPVHVDLMTSLDPTDG